jgi:purine-binding chemotaxis protein CheW
MPDPELAHRNTMAATRAGKAVRYLTFRLATEAYGIEILKVQEIVGLQPITFVPRTPDFIRGVINLRGKILPVVDLKRRFAMRTTRDTGRTCIVIMRVEDSDRRRTFGILVDDVPAVVAMNPDEIGPPPEFGANIDLSYLVGVSKNREQLIMLLDIDKILSAGEMDRIENTSELEASTGR